MWRKLIPGSIVLCAVLLTIPVLLQNLANVSFKNSIDLAATQNLKTPADYCRVSSALNRSGTDCAMDSNCLGKGWLPPGSLAASLGQNGDSDYILSFYFRGLKEWCAGSKTRAIELWKNYGPIISKPFVWHGEQMLLLGDAPHAIEWFELAQQLRPDDSKIAQELGEAYMRRGAASEALRAFEQSVALDPNSAPAYAGAAIAAYSLGEYSKVEKYILKAIDLAPDNVTYWQIYGAYLLNNKNDPVTAEFWLRRVVAADANNSQAQFALVDALVRQGRLPDAQVALQNAVRTAQDPHRKAEYLVTYANALMAREQWQDAAKSYEQALGYDPNLLDAAVSLAAVYARFDRCDDVKRIVALYPIRNQPKQALTAALTKCGIH